MSPPHIDCDRLVSDALLCRARGLNDGRNSLRVTLYWSCVVFSFCCLKQMPRVKVVTLQQAISYIEELNDEDLESADVAVLPPENKVDSDLEEGGDDEVGVLQEIQDIPGTLEIGIQATHTSEEFEVSHEDTEPVTVTWDIAAEPKWQHYMGRYTRLAPDGSVHEQKMIAMKEELIDSSPLELFEKMFDSRCVKLFVEETNRYAAQKNESGFQVLPEEIKAFIGILFLSGYHRLPSQEHYWSLDSDLQVPIVRECMPQKAFLAIKRFLHCNNNNLLSNDENKDDRSFKVKPFFDLLNENFQQFGFFNKHLSVDEMIIKYFGHHGLKQFIRGKPIRFGYKLWALCGDNGYVYAFDLYQGSEKKPDVRKVPLGARVVLELASKVDDPQGKELFFDNLFTSPSLLVTLTKMGFRATGTIRRTWTKKVPFAFDNDMKERGAIDQQFDKANQLLFVKWNDNNFVRMATNFSSVEPKVKATRFSRKEKKKMEIAMPRIIAEYNKHMGGVDHHDWLASHYAIGIRGKKWYFPLVMRGLQMALVNSWLIHKYVVDKKEQLSLLEFTRQIAVAYMKLTHGQPTMLSRRRATHATGVARLTSQTRFDGIGHLRMTRSNQRRCQGYGCGARPLSYCCKCDVTLCKNCFLPYHTK